MAFKQIYGEYYLVRDEADLRDACQHFIREWLEDSPDAIGVYGEDIQGGLPDMGCDYPAMVRLTVNKNAVGFLHVYADSTPLAAIKQAIEQF